MLHIREISDSELKRFNQLEKKHHYMGETRSGGHTMRLVAVESGEWVALLSWGAASYRLKARDEYIGWTRSMRADRQKLVVQNRRFTLLSKPGERPNLASQVLACCVRMLPELWFEKFGYKPLLAETFSDRESASGTCYRASGWEALGLTKGFARSRHTGDYYVDNKSPKKLWIKTLHPKACELLCAHKLPAEYEKASGSDNHGVLPLLSKQIESLQEALSRVPDPRARNRKFHIGAMLTLLTMGVMTGMKDLQSIVRYCNKLTMRQRALLGLPRFDRKGQGEYRCVPSYSAFYNLLKQLNPDSLAEVVGTWIRENEGQLPRQLALDGKFIQNVTGLVSLSDTETGVPVAMAQISQKKKQGEKCEVIVGRKLLRETDLSNAVVSLDALHCQQETVREVVMSGGEALVQVKKNQKTIYQNCARITSGSPPFFQHQK